MHENAETIDRLGPDASHRNSFSVSEDPTVVVVELRGFLHSFKAAFALFASSESRHNITRALPVNVAVASQRFVERFL